MKKLIYFFLFALIGNVSSSKAQHATINFTVPAKSKYLLVYYNSIGEPIDISFPNKSGKDTVITRKLNFPTYQIIHFGLTISRAGNLDFVLQNFFIKNGDQVFLKLNKDYQIEALRNSVIINENYLNLFSPFTKNGELTTVSANTGSAPFYESTELNYQQNLAKIQQGFDDHLFGKELSDKLKMINRSDYFNRFFGNLPKTLNIQQKKILDAKCLELEAEVGNLINPSQDYTNFYNGYINYKMLSVDNRKTLGQCFDTALANQWNKDVVIAYLIDKLSNEPDKSSPAFVNSFERLKIFAGPTYSKHLDSLKITYFPIITDTEKIELINEKGKTFTLDEVLLASKGNLIFIDFGQAGAFHAERLSLISPC